MASLLHKYEYDIFISYRHNDNRGGWVTEFVHSLKDELAATVKDAVSIYYDTNPHDGLHETHDVDGSLKEKIKCLVFISIVSQTYCDPKSFAWQKEFLPFLDFAKQDEFGLDIKVSGGNVAKRILPIRIHEIDDTDTRLFEEAIGGVMRPVDFIFKSAGVNRPLSPTDNRDLNQNKILYKDQVNKVANAIKDIISSLKSGTFRVSKQTEPTPVTTRRSRFSIKKVGVAVVSLMILFAVVYGVSQLTRSTNESEGIDKSIAVLPFVNMSADPEQEYFSDGISEELINALAKMTNLKVAGRTSSFSFKDKHEDLRKVGESLGVKTILEGSVRKSGNMVRITAQLIDVDNGFHLWTQTFDRELSDIFEVQDEITAAIIAELKVHLNEKDIQETKHVNIESYTIYLKARQKLAQRGVYNLIEARNLFYQSLQLDSSYSPAYSGLSKTLSLINNYSQGDSRFKNAHEEALTYAKKALAIDPDNAEAYMATGIAKGWYLWDWESAEKDIRKSIELNPKDAEVNNFAGDFYRIISDYDKAKYYETRAIELDPLHAVNHFDLATTLIYMGKSEEAKEFLRSCYQLDKNLLVLINPALIMPYTKDPFIYELDSLSRTLDIEKHPSSIILHIKTILALGKGDMDLLRKNVNELEVLAAQGGSSHSYLFVYYLILDESAKAQYWAKKAVEEKDVQLVYEPYKLLPENYSDLGVRAALSSPELEGLYQIRRKNLGLTSKQ